MPPTRQSGKQSKTLIWDDTNKIWKAWDGAITTGDIEIGAVEIKDGATDAKVVVKTDGVNNAMVVTQNSVPTHAVTQSGTWDIGTLTGITNDVAVTGTFWQTTQPVSGTFWQTTQPISGTVSATQSGTWDIGTLTGITNDVSVTGTFWQTTQPVSATDLDIRNLAYASDAVTTHQGGTWDIATVTTLTGITNTVTVDATDLDIRDLTSASDSVAAVQSGTWNIATVATLTDITNSVSIKDENENQRILDTDDAVTTVNYADSDKDSVSSIVTASATLSRKVTDTYNNGGATTLVITRTTGDV